MGVNAAIERRRSLLPDPDAPRMDRISFGSIVNDKSSNSVIFVRFFIFVTFVLLFCSCGGDDGCIWNVL